MVTAAWEEFFGKPVNIPEVSPLWGLVLVLLGVGVCMLDIRFRTARERQHQVPERPTIARIRHESMEALTQPLLVSSLPAEMACADIHDFFINQSSFY